MANGFTVAAAALLLVPVSVLAPASALAWLPPDEAPLCWLPDTEPTVESLSSSSSLPENVLFALRSDDESALLSPAELSESDISAGTVAGTVDGSSVLAVPTACYVGGATAAHGTALH